MKPVLISVLVLFLIAAVPVPAQDPPAEAGEPAETLTRKERKQQAKDARIAEYLRKKEEKRLRKAQAQELAKEEAEEALEAEKLEAEQLAEQAAEPARTPLNLPGTVAAEPEAGMVADVEPIPKKKKKEKKDERAGALPRELARAQRHVRQAGFDSDPTVMSYLELIDRQGASPHQLAAFGNFLAQNGMVRDALEYYKVALRLEKADPVLWINSGTLHRQLGSISNAQSAFATALSINPNSALAHYNLGAILDEQGKYDDAMTAYKTALIIDPTLADPAYNPQAANNDRLLAVKLMLYKQESGSLGLPLVDVKGGHLVEPE